MKEKEKIEGSTLLHSGTILSKYNFTPFSHNDLFFTIRVRWTTVVDTTIIRAGIVTWQIIYKIIWQIV
jgi:hypothetical protein